MSRWDIGRLGQRTSRGSCVFVIFESSLVAFRLRGVRFCSAEHAVVRVGGRYRKVMEDQTKAYLHALAAVLLWSTVASAFKLSLNYVDNVELLLYSNFFSVLILGIILATSKRLGELFRCTRKQYLRSFLLGVLNPFLYYLVLFKAYELLPAQEAQPLNYTWAITLAVLSVPLLGQRISGADFAGLLLGYCGVVIISTHGDVLGFNISAPTGVTLALASTVIWALYWIYNTNDTRHPVVCLSLSFVIGLFLVAVYYGLFHEHRVPGLKGILGAAYVGAFEMSVTYVMWLMALRFSENTAKVASLIFVSPFLSLVFIHFFVGEPIKSSTVVGLILIVIGLLVQKYGFGRRS
jgi:drug/metabolite transporter (DMT)-like permease